MVGALMRNIKPGRGQAEDHLNLENSGHPGHDLGSVLFPLENTAYRYAAFRPIVDRRRPLFELAFPGPPCWSSCRLSKSREKSKAAQSR
ncbi:unnamed protein product [Fusarium graminearum]|uniref:Chromosome 3, complete genome n=1 Tax=Gibberella zeae (strain ATCC MYA-4620 / CBS 123657 / FGSC 9075 / NRRL 31084 / PH-1) TaxID=229533 RepID=A0A098E3Z2_GIBZE|nr:unnamed protein product [Fusarium graminearum]